MSDDPESQAKNEKDESFPCTWIFVPLPHYLPVPHGWKSAELSDPADYFTNAAGIGLDSSLCVMQVPRSRSPLLDDMHDIVVGALREKSRHSTAAASSSSTPPEIDLSDEQRQLFEADVGHTTVLTLIEVAFPGQPDPDMEDLLERAIERARWLQQAVAVLSQDAVRLVSRRQIPPLVLIVTGHVHTGGRLPTYDELILHRVERSAPPQAYSIRSAELDLDKLEKLGATMSSVVVGSSFMAYGDLRREAFVQHQFEGNERLAVTTLGTAGEVLTNTLILHLLWEEGLDPYDAASTFDPTKAHTGQLAEHLPGRLGGNWSRTGPGPVSRYVQDLVHLRHRVVHAGIRPETAAVDAAVDALIQFERFIGDRLCEPRNLNRFTRTAMAFVGNRGIQRRNRWTRRVEALTTDESQPNWELSFVRWRTHLDLALDPTSPAPGSDPSRLQLFAEIEDYETLFYLRDDATLQVVEVVGPAFTTQSVLDTMAGIEATLTDPQWHRVRLHLEANQPVPKQGWRPEYEVLRDVTVSPA